MTEILGFVIGAVVGSFLNVCIYRIPKKISIVHPSSFCPNCGEKIRFYDNIPIVSYLILKGRCRNCKSQIPIRYLVVEIISAVITAIVWKKFGILKGIYYSVLFWGLIVVSFIDIEHFEIPVEVCYFVLVFGIFLSPFLGIGFVDSILGASFGAGLVLFIIETYYVFTKKEGMGYGDANVLSVIGAYIGWQKVLTVLFVASFLGTLFALTWWIFKRKLERTLPFAPFLSLGAVLVVLFERLNFFAGLS